MEELELGGGNGDPRGIDPPRFAEDGCRVRVGHAAETFAVLRHLALNLLRQERSTTVGIKAKRLKAAWDHDDLLKVLAT